MAALSRPASDLGRGEPVPAPPGRRDPWCRSTPVRPTEQGAAVHNVTICEYVYDVSAGGWDRRNPTSPAVRLRLGMSYPGRVEVVRGMRGRISLRRPAMAAAVAEDGGGLRPCGDREIAALGCASVDRLAGEERDPPPSFPVRHERTARYRRRSPLAFLPTPPPTQRASPAHPSPRPSPPPPYLPSPLPPPPPPLFSLPSPPTTPSSTRGRVHTRRGDSAGYVRTAPRVPSFERRRSRPLLVAQSGARSMSVSAMVTTCVQRRSRSGCYRTATFLDTRIGPVVGGK